ncbi:MAG: phosphatidate cytidylyltransferase [Pseudomonadota bacterium]
MSDELRLRIISGVLLAALAIFIDWVGGILFTTFLCLVAGILLFEWLRMLETSSDILGKCFYWLFLLAGIGALELDAVNEAYAAAAFGTICLFLWSLVYGNSKLACFGIAYALLPVIALYALRNHSSGDGGMLVFGLFMLVWATDSAAYFVGRSVGGPKLWPAVSPNKTWSGFFGGLFGGAVAAVIAAFFVNWIGVLAAFFGGALVSVTSQLGDLFESLLKRRSGVKDSGSIIPGHGGVMDRVDGLIFAAVAAQLLIYLSA